MCPQWFLPQTPRFCPVCGIAISVPASLKTQTSWDTSNIPEEHFQPFGTSNTVSSSHSPGPISQSKRKRSPSPEDRPTRQRKRASKEHVRIGKHAARTLRISFRADVIFHAGLKHLASKGWDCSEVNQDIEEFPDGSFSDIGLFFELIRQIPDCLKRLQEDDADGSYQNEIIDALERGVNTARSDDCSGLKMAVLGILESYFDFKADRRLKSNRGFKDQALGRLLCPPRLDWDDESIRAQLRNGDVRPSPLELPPFLYCKYTVNPTGILDGLLESDLLIKAARHIFIAPSAGIEDSHRTSQPRRPGNAALNDMECVTIPTIAYVATIVRFTLSSDEIFTLKGGATPKGGFDYWRFYKSIVEMLRHPDMKTKTADLVKYWNRQVFGPSSKNDEEEHNDMKKAIAAAIAKAGGDAARCL